MLPTIDYEQLVWDEVAKRFELVEQLGLEDEYQDQAYMELPIKVTKRDKGSQAFAALWYASIAKQNKYQEEFQKLEAETLEAEAIRSSEEIQLKPIEG